MKVRTALDQLATPALREVARHHGLPDAASSTHDELVGRVAARLEDATYLAGYLARLSEPDRNALALVARRGGELRGFQIAAALDAEDPNAVQTLVGQGLLIRTFVATGAHRGEVYTLPDEVAAVVRSAMAEPADAPVQPPSATTSPERAEQRATDPAFSLFALASFVQRQASLTGSPPLPAAALSALRGETQSWAQEPGGWEWQERWTFLRHLGRLVGLLARDRESGLVVTSQGPDLLGQRSALQGRLWRAYLNTREWVEIAHAGIVQGEQLAVHLESPPARASVCALLAGLPPGTWYEIDELIMWVRAAHADFLREQLDARSATLHDPASGQPLLRVGGWESIEQPFLRFMLLGPLYWLGLLKIDTAGKRASLTQTGAALLRGEPLPPPAAPEHCDVDDDGQLRASARADLKLLLRAERFLALEQRGRVSTYRLDRARIADALGSGHGASEGRQLLEQLLAGSLPESLSRLFAEVEERFGAITLRPAALLETRTEEEMEEIARAPRMASLLRRRVGPRVAEVAASQSVEVAQALREAGHLPRVDAALRLMADRRAYAGLVDEHVLEYLLVTLLAAQQVAPEHFTRLEGAPALLARLQTVFGGAHGAKLADAADELARQLAGSSGSPPSRRPRSRRKARPRG